MLRGISAASAFMLHSHNSMSSGMIWPILIAILTLVVFLLLSKGHRIHCHGARLKRPSDTLPILGNAIRFLQPRHVLFDWFIQQQDDFGKETYEISVPSLPPGVVINSSENLEYVLKNESAITKGPFFRDRSWDLFGYGIINASGELWRAQRKAGLKFFGSDSLDALIEDVLPDAYQKARAELLELSKIGEQTDLQRFFLDLTTAVVGQMAYDMEIDTSSPFSKAFDYASDHIARRFQNPLYQITELFTGARFRASVDEVKQFGLHIVRTAKKRRSHAAFDSLVTNSEPVFGSLIDSLIESFRNPNVIADSAMNFLSAGRDTTAQSLTWTFYALMRHPHIVPSLLKEINERNPSTEDINVSALQPSNIPYTMAVFYESLRLYPPVPLEIKQCEGPITLPDGTSLPSSSIVVWCIWALNRSPRLYGADAKIFRPERWLDPTTGLFSPKTAFEFPVFNGGPRACLGKKMAELMGAWIIVNLVREFEFQEVKDGEKERVSQSSLTLPMEGGLPCKIRVRLTNLPMKPKEAAGDPLDSDA